MSRIENGQAIPSLRVIQALATELSLDPGPLERRVLGAQLIRLVGGELTLEQLKQALAYLASDDSPLDRALSWSVGLTPEQALQELQGRDDPGTD